MLSELIFLSLKNNVGPIRTQLNTVLDGELTMDNNSAGQPPQAPILMSTVTLYYTGTWVFPQTTLDFPSLQHIANI
jgi:hypothetical protein